MQKRYKFLQQLYPHVVPTFPHSTICTLAVFSLAPNSCHSWESNRQRHVSSGKDYNPPSIWGAAIIQLHGSTCLVCRWFNCQVNWRSPGESLPIGCSSDCAGGISDLMLIIVKFPPINPHSLLWVLCRSCA